AAAESLPESLAESCSGSEAPHPASSTRARAARAACSMRASDFGGWIRAWSDSARDGPCPHRIVGRLLVVFGCSCGPKVSEHDHLLSAASSRQRWSVETTARAPVERRDNGGASRPLRARYISS